MNTLESLRKKMGTVGQLGSIVRTMKVLAAVSIRQYQRAADSLERYRAAVQDGLHIALAGMPLEPKDEKDLRALKAGIVVFGSDQGMCGPFNERIVSFALAEAAREGMGDASLAAVGERAAELLAARYRPPEKTFSVPVNTDGITAQVNGLIVHIERWTAEGNIGRVEIVHHRFTGGWSYRPERVPLLPVDAAWLREIQERKWPTRVLPAAILPRGTLFPALVREHVFVSLYRAFAQSLAAENAARLAAMQAAEQHIDDYLRDLTLDFHHLRQSSVTEEIMDVIGGFEALT